MTNDTQHKCFSVNTTNYLRNFDSSQGGKVYAVHYEAPPRRNENGTTSLSLILPTLIVSDYMQEPEKIAQHVAELLNLHWEDDGGLEEGRVAIDVLTGSLSTAQRKLLARLQPARGYPAEDLRFTYSVHSPGNGLQTCAALARRQMVVSISGGEQPFENRGQGHIRLTPLGALIQKRIRMEVAHV